MPVVVNFFRKCPLLHNFSRDPYCIYNFYISGTTAIIVTQGIFDFFISGLFIHIQKSFRAHYHARNAKAALYGTSLSVCIRIYLFFPLCQTFYCNDISAIQQTLQVLPSIITVQAPQAPSLQPSFTEVRCNSSRRNLSSF